MSSTFAVGPAIPALLTRTSRPPSSRPTSTKSRSTSANKATSARVRVIFAGSDLSAASSISHTCTRAPWSTKVCAMARPIPAAPAVISTRLPLAERFIAFH